MKPARLLLGLWFLCGAAPLLAQVPGDALQLLQRVGQAARKLSYSGTFVYRSGDVAETSRIVHVVDGAKEIERIEMLDGSPREVLRVNDEVKCFLPENLTVFVERRPTPRAFPALLPANFGGINENYSLRKGAPARIAGLDSQSILIEPRDKLRYARQLWIDSQSGLLLKAGLLNEKGEQIESFAFTELRIGEPIDRTSLTPRLGVKSGEWRFHQSLATDARGDGGHWVFRNALPGFSRISGMRRQRSANAPEGSHLVFSDGLASISVFIEPLDERQGKPETGLFALGALNVYKRLLDGHLLVLIGDVPHVALQKLGDGIEARRK